VLLRGVAVAVLGDLLALAGGLAGAGYVDLGERARRGLSPSGYSTVAYGTCALIKLVVCLATGVHLVGYQRGTWLQVLVIVVRAGAGRPVADVTPSAGSPRAAAG
jgi:hypothetical protein